MHFLLRFVISLLLAMAIPAGIVFHAQPHAWRSHFLFTYAFAWLFLVPISLYSSPTASLKLDGNGQAVPVFASRVARRTRAGTVLLYGSAAVFLLYLLVSTYELERQGGWLVVAALIAIMPIGGYIFLTSMCPYCGKLNRPDLGECENCGNKLPTTPMQRKRRVD